MQLLKLNFYKMVPEQNGCIIINIKTIHVTCETTMSYSLASCVQWPEVKVIGVCAEVHKTEDVYTYKYDNSNIRTVIGVCFNMNINKSIQYTLNKLSANSCAYYTASLF